MKTSYGLANNGMEIFILFIRAVFVALIFVVLQGMLSLKTMYYVTYMDETLKLIYTVLPAILYVAYLCSFVLRRRIHILMKILISLLIGYIPYERVYDYIYQLILNPTEHLSAISKILPTFLAVIFDILFPFLVVFALLSLTSLVIRYKSKHSWKSNN